MDADASLALDALQAVLQHGSDFLNKRELGRASIVSKSASKIVEDVGVWKRVWEQAVEVGRDFGRTFVPRGLPSNMKENYNLTTWHGEPGLLPFFAAPDQRTLDSVGYKHAAGCLLSKHCFHCGMMAATANPFTLSRICEKCYYTNEDSFAICKSKAKEAFLLGEKDLRSLVSISHSVPLITGGDNVGTSVMYLMSDVKEASFEKWGGEDGLAEEFTTRTEKAMTKYTKSQSTVKPQKKRPKISKMSHRPADDLASLRSWWLPILVGCSFVELGTNEPKMMHPCDCHICDIKGRPLDVMRHERFDHGQYFPVGHLDQAEGRNPPAGLTGLSNLELPNELTQILATAENTYVREVNSHEDIRGHDLIMNMIGNMLGFRMVELVQLFDLKFPGLDCKIALDFFFGGPSGGGLTEAMGFISGDGSFVVSCQLCPNTAPVELLSLCTMGSRVEASEADEAVFRTIKEALELHETTSAQLLAALLSRAMSLNGFKTKVLGRDSLEDLNVRSIPVMREAMEIWSAGTDNESEDTSDAGSGSEGSSDNESEESLDY